MGRAEAPALGRHRFSKRSNKHSQVPQLLAPARGKQHSATANVASVRRKRCGRRSKQKGRTARLQAKTRSIQSTHTRPVYSRRILEGMVDVIHPRCEHHTCSSQPSYHFEGESGLKVVGWPPAARRFLASPQRCADHPIKFMPRTVTAL